MLSMRVFTGGNDLGRRKIERRDHCLDSAVRALAR